MWKKIAEMQLVANGRGCCCFRDLYEKDGNCLYRVSARTSDYFYIEDQRKLGENYPSNDVLFARFALPKSEIVWEPSAVFAILAEREARAGNKTAPPTV